MAFNVLVLDAAQRSALAVTRSLGRLPDIKVTTAEAAAASLAGHSRFSSHYLQCPSSENTPQEFIQWLAALIAVQPFDLVIPVTEITSQLLLLNAAVLKHLHLPFANYETVMALADKGQLVTLAQQLGVPHPRSQWFSSAAELNIADIQFPIVLKPCLSKIFTGDHWIATTVRILFSIDDLRKTLAKDTYLQNSSFMLQEFIPGHGAGIFCLYKHGQPIAFFAHQRLREKPPQGGVSVLSESVAVDPILKDHATKLLNHVHWHGVAMVEFRVAADGTAYLMEVNTRFWGSLQLAIDAGVDFPQLLLKAERGEKLDNAPDYHIGQRLRWLLGDFDSLYIYLKGNYRLGQKLLRVLAFLTPNRGCCRHEVNRFGDFGPAKFELKIYLKQLLGH